LAGFLSGPETESADRGKLLGILFFFGSLWGSLYLNERLPLAKYAEPALMKFLSAKQDEICGLLAQPKPSCPTYVATVPRDEAAFVLTSVDNVSATPWIAWDVAVRAAATVLFSWATLSIYGGIIFNTPPSVGVQPLNNIVLGILLVIILGPFFATPIVAALRAGVFGSEGLLAASTVRIQPSKASRLDESKTCRVQYPPNKSIPGYRHCFFYSDEHVIEDVATWIRLGGQNAGCPASWRGSKQRPALQAFMARWFIPVAASVTMLASFGLSNDISEFRRVKFDLASDASPIRDSTGPVLQIERTFEGGKYEISGFPPWETVLPPSFPELDRC